MKSSENPHSRGSAPNDLASSIFGIAGATVGGAIGADAGSVSRTGLADDAVPHQHSSGTAGGRCTCGLVDVHVHFLPPCYAQALSDAGMVTVDGGFPTPKWSEAGALAHMDKHNIEASIVSVSSPSVTFLKSKLAKRRLAREINVFAADLIKRHPNRFGAFGTLPLPDIKASVAEIGYALDHLRLDGVTMESNIYGVYLGDQRMDPIFAELNRRKATLFLHPTSPACFEAVGLGRPAPILEFPLDTTRTVTDLIFAGTLTRYPDIRMIIPHAGGALTALADRLAAFSSLPFLDQRPGADEVRRVLSSLYYDLAGSATNGAIEGLRRLTSLTHILFGSDFPFSSGAAIDANVEGFRTLDRLSVSEHEAMARHNAHVLFPRLNAQLQQVGASAGIK